MKEKYDNTIEQLKKAAEAGAAVVLDSEVYATRNTYVNVPHSELDFVKWVKAQRYVEQPLTTATPDVSKYVPAPQDPERPNVEAHNTKAVAFVNKGGAYAW